MAKIFKELLKNLEISKEEFQVVDSNFYNRFNKADDNLTLIIGESYMAEEWKSNNLANFFRKITKQHTKNQIELLLPLLKKYPINISKLIFRELKLELQDQFINNSKNNQSIELSKRVGEQHYDIPDILYEYMLCSNRQYTCGYWKPNTITLEEAQQNKIKLLIDKLQIPEDTEMNILDIGCGWGGLTYSINLRYPKCKLEGISISQEQINYANNKYAKNNNNLKYYYCDYRDLPNKNKKYDRIISVGMFEHVGLKNFDIFFDTCKKIITDDGIFVLHTITKQTRSTYLTGQPKYSINAWTDKYIFPGAYIPTAEQILTVAQSNGLMFHHIQNLSTSYAKTLSSWYNNFITNWSEIQKTNTEFFTIKFYKMWEFYLLSCMVEFEEKNLQLTQYVFTKKDYDGMYIFVEK